MIERWTGKKYFIFGRFAQFLNNGGRLFVATNERRQKSFGKRPNFRDGGNTFDGVQNANDAQFVRNLLTRFVYFCQAG